MKRLALLLAVLLAPVVANAGDLDTAKFFWATVNGQLGRDSTIAYVDTMNYPPGAIYAAVNACIRDVATDIGIFGLDTIEVTYGTYTHSLNSNFIPGGIDNIPLSVTGKSAAGDYIYTLEEGDPGEITNYVEVSAAITKFKIEGTKITFSSSVGQGDTLTITGPVTGTPFSNAASVPNIPDADRSAVCDCATARLAMQVQNQGLADFYRGLYQAHVAMRSKDKAVPVP